MQTFNRRTVVAALAALGSLGSQAQASGRTPAPGPAPFPSRPLRIVVPNAAGGAADITARTVAQKLAGPLGQSVVIENKPSAGGVVAGDLVARAEPDGHTLLLISSGTAVSAALFKSLPFDTLADLRPVSLLATFDLAVVVREGGRFRTLGELLAYGQAHPGELNIGTPQLGTTQNLAAELLKATAGLKAQVVPFNGTPPVITALRGGQVDAMVDILGGLMPQIASGALRPLAVMGAERAPQLPRVPTVRESGAGFAGFNVTSWNGLAVPARTPAPVVERLSREVQAALAQPDVQQRLRDLNLQARGSTPAQAADHLAADVRRWAGVIERAGIARQ